VEITPVHERDDGVWGIQLFYGDEQQAKTFQVPDATVEDITKLKLASCQRMTHCRSVKEQEQLYEN
jgi:hypothetical protein